VSGEGLVEFALFVGALQQGGGAEDGAVEEGAVGALELVDQ
jgi:hypothetical protein